ncbi:hypothetical protein [Pseudarthrobacter sp. NS4]|uniref:hypothetical protein n=1 Tax=Pseudarthrobacter sp. NS4 TaxID=2973976 RepID=UPI002163ADAD|nr:hypothetical protein [Pseudarthrobacter sp. NS4]
MTRGGTLLRYAVVSVLLIAAQLVSLWFHSAGVYQGKANVPLREFPGDVDVFFVLTFAPTIVGLKYLVYDVAVRAFTKDYRTPALLLCFVAGYAAALAFDVACLFAASKPVADAGFAILGTIMQSPLILLAAGGIIAAAVLLKDRPPQAGATPSPGL